MLLAIDSGNTNIVFALYDGEVQRGQWRASSDSHRTADEHAVWLMALMALQGVTPGDVSGAIIANVVPANARALETLCRRYFRTDPVVVGAKGVDLGLAVLLPNPAEVGEDRLVNAVAAQARYPGEKIIVDFGTATTFDIVDAEGSYIGGVIAPGVNLSLEALYMAAARLPRIGIARPEQVIGRSTVPAMQSGIFWGYVGMVEGLVARIRAEYGAKDPTVIGTGGLAVLFADATEAIDHVDPDLTMRGLLEIYRRNRPK
ncbi:MAG: type III pantothenate kinase [Proteobacteria bacterium]|nr:type III pantothenate kinase [Pseudomonadota bacterium]